MSHHGDHDKEVSEAMRALLKASQKGLQGEFPRGRLNARDEGAIAVGIGHQEGKVVLSFPSPTAWIGFSPEQAFDIAESLIKAARECGCKRLLTLTL
jgi:hypothetical protein